MTVPMKEPVSNSPSRPRRPWRLGLVWLAMTLAAGGALGYDVVGSHRPLTLDQRVAAIASQVRCPSCQDETADHSTTQTAAAVRATIRQRLLAGQNQGEIEAYLESRYGPTILLRPPAGGISGLVWALPVAAAITALGALAMAFRRWRPHPAAAPLTAEERSLLDQARDG